MSIVFRVQKYLQYRLSAGNAHGLHSPFVYDLYTNIITDETPFYAFEKVEAIRSSMHLSKEKIEVQDYGTGKPPHPPKGGLALARFKRREAPPLEGLGRLLSLSFIADHYVKPKKYGQLLARLVNNFRPINVLEIGTSLGITTMYLSILSKDIKTISLEGSSTTASIARRNFQQAGVENIEIIEGEFDESLPKALKEFKQLDFVYFDGNHQKDATLKYFSQCLSHHHENSVFVFDDIYWSRGMAEAWEEIKANDNVTVTIDLYSIGLVFFRKGIPKQDFRLRF